jgi:hypothetical protein
MGQIVGQEAGLERSSFVQSCAYCGARFEVLLSRLRSADEHERLRVP